MTGGARSQKGMGLLGLLFWVVLAGMVFWLGSRIVPLYFEYWSIERVFQEQVQKGSLYGSPRELEREVIKELRFQDLTRLKAEDIQVKPAPGGDRYRVFAEYQAEVPLFNGVRLVIPFQPEATEGG